MQPTRAAVRALDAAHGLESASCDLDLVAQAAIAAEFVGVDPEDDAATIANAAEALNLSPTVIGRYLFEDPCPPFKGDIQAVQLMWASWQELNP